MSYRPPAQRTSPVARMVAIGSLLSLVPIVVIASMCSPSRPPAAVAQATAVPTFTVAAPTAVPPTVAPTLAPTVALPTVAPTVPPKPTSPPATAKPAAPVVDLVGKFEPRTLRVGQKLVVELTLTNKSERPIEGLRYFSSGPWDKYTVVNVTPNGRFESGMLGYNVYSGMMIPPGQSRALNIVAYPNEAGNHRFTFIPNENTTALVGEDGRGITIGGQVAVIR